VEPDKIRHPLIGYERWQLATDAHISLICAHFKWASAVPSGRAERRFPRVVDLEGNDPA
jgi:hypothetical protein